VSVRDRTLAWDGCINVRDLGGHPTQDGGTTRFGTIVRADSVRQLSEAGWNALVDYGIERLVDLRFDHELAEDPPGHAPIEVVRVSLLGEGPLDEIDALVAGVTDAVLRRKLVYLAFLQRFRDRFAQAVSVVAQAPSGGVVVHCAGGVDRTGLVCALLLRLANVGVNDIAQDWALSEQNLAPLAGEWIEAAEDETERMNRRLLARCVPQSMVEVLEELERRYGSIAEYLSEGGATEADVERIRARLLG
jgi:protein-tyrosine phosphatase